MSKHTLKKRSATGFGPPANGRSENTQSFSSGSVVQKVNQLIEQAVSSGASDIHLEPYEQRYRLRYRLDGMLMHAAELPVRQKQAIISRIKIMADLDIAEKRRPQDGRIRIEQNQREIDLRVSTLPTEFGEKIVLRILDKKEQQLDLERLGFGSQSLEGFREAIHHPYGMILVTGPTGSGKTTTLYAALNELNNPDVNITTIEDPIEYNLEGINQTQVHTDIGLTFSHALRSILRQDPDIIMIGEIRDRETAEIAIRAALTGHLVFATLHTNDAPSAVARLLDMGIEPFLVASSVRLVMAQRLVRTVCQECSRPVKKAPPKMEVDELPKDTVDLKGCDACNQTGYRGRTALNEMMSVSKELSAMIGDGAGTGVLKEQAMKEGMQTLRQAGMQKISEGTTTREEVLRETLV